MTSESAVRVDAGETGEPDRAASLSAASTEATGATEATEPGPRRLGDPLPPDLLDAGERMSVDELRRHQLERLQATLRLAYENVELYRRKFDAAGVRPEDCRSLEDLARFPFTTKADLREAYPFGMFAVPMADVRRIHASSGTTGRPTVVGYTEADLSMWADLIARSIRAAGGRPGHKVHVAYGYGLFTGGLGAHYGAERLGCTVIPASGGMTERQVRLIVDFEPEIIMLTPSYMLTLLDEFERQGVDPRGTSLQVGIFGAEPWTEQMRLEIEERAGIHAVDIYGLSEVIGPGVSQECVETKDGLHIWEDHFYPEVVDPDTGAVLAEGEMAGGRLGELAFTSLTKQALPVIRYRTRDLTRLLPGTARPAFRRMQKVTGRCDDMIILRGVNVFPTQIEEIVLRTAGLAPHFQLRLTRQGRLDQLTVLVEARPGAGPEQRAAAAAQLAHGVKEGVGVTVGVEVLEPESVERSAGKMRRVIDEREHQQPVA
jgi:phenylacetate-CoA ligase